MKEPIYIFNPSDELLAITSNYQEGMFEEAINDTISFELIYPADDQNSKHIVGGNQIAFKDLEGSYRLFVIREPEYENSGEGTNIRALCLPAMDELNDTYVEDIRPYDKTAEYALGRILENTRYQVGNVDDFGIQSTNFYYINVKQALKDIVSTWGGELVDRVEINENGISGRFIDLIYRRGEEVGKVWETDKDIDNINRKVKYYPKTALYGKGSSLETENGGHTRKITFADIEWSVDNGDPVDKPLGQEWVGDNEALIQHGIPTNEGIKHRMGMFEDGDIKDPEKLLQKTWDALQDLKEPKAQYEMSIVTFEGISGMEHELVRLGDTGRAIDRNHNPNIVIEARVIKMSYDIGDPSTGEVVLGNFIDLFENDRKLDWVVDKVQDKGGIWDSVENDVTDDDFPDIVPDPPTNVNADGLFRTILIEWDYEPSSYIASYEVYASKVKGFVPDSTNLIFRGKTGMFSHKAEVNEQWYYRLRTVNTHGTSSGYSEEVSATTQKIQDIDLAIGSVNAEKLDDLAVTAAKLSQGAVETQHIANQAVGNQAIENQAVTNQKIANQAVGYSQIQKAVITDELVAPEAKIDFAKIANVVVNNAMIEDLAVTNAKIGGQIDANKLNITGVLQAINGESSTTIDGGKIDAETLSVLAANIDGKLTANQLEVSGLIQAINGEEQTTIDGGKIDAQTLNVLAANIQGQLTANQIDASELEVDMANVNGLLSANRLGAGTIDGNEITVINIKADNIDGRIAKLADYVSIGSSTADTVYVGTNDSKELIFYQGSKYKFGAPIEINGNRVVTDDELVARFG